MKHGKIKIGSEALEIVSSVRVYGSFRECNVRAQSDQMLWSSNIIWATSNIELIKKRDKEVARIKSAAKEMQNI